MGSNTYFFKKISIFLSTLFILSLFIFSLSCYCSYKDNSSAKGYIAIIIDDFGGGNDGVNEMLKLNIPLTAAVMPFLQNTNKHMELAHENGLEIILHTPMEPKTGKPSWLGPRGITTNLSNEEIKSRVSDALNEVHYAVGMNNHMGSTACEDERVVTSILEVAKDKNLFFIDSKTTPNSKISSVGKNLGVPILKRDVFLDHEKSIYAVEKGMLKASDIALKNGYAIVIGHVGEQGGKITAQGIKNTLKEIEKRGIKLVYIKDGIKSNFKYLDIMNNHVNFVD